MGEKWDSDRSHSWGGREGEGIHNKINYAWLEGLCTVASLVVSHIITPGLVVQNVGGALKGLGGGGLLPVIK